MARRTSTPSDSIWHKHAAEDVLLQRRQDARRQFVGEQVTVRLGALEVALAAFEAGEDGAGWAYRQALVDVASMCSELAGRLPSPRDANGLPRRMAA